MNIAPAICDNTYATVVHETGTRGKEAPEQSGEGPQPRFADVLPRAKAALERPPGKKPAEKAPAQARSTNAKAAVDSPVKADRPTRSRGRQGENTQADPQVVMWPFPGVVRPATPRQAPVGSAGVQPARAAQGQPPAEPVVPGRGPKTAAQATTPELPVQRTTDVRPAVAQGRQTKAVEGGQPAGVHAATNTAPNVAAPKRQEAARPAEPMGKQAPVVSQGPQEPKAAPVVSPPAQTMAGEVRAGRADTPKERAKESPAVRVVHPAPQVNRQETPAPVKPAPGGRPGPVEGKAEQAPAQNQPLPPQPTGGSEPPSKPGRELQEQALSTEGRQDVASKPAAHARREGPKVEAVPMDAKDTPSSGPKETGAAAAPELRVLASGDVATASQRAAAQPQSHTVVDVPPARSPVQSVGEQILDSMQAAAARGDRQILVRLNPPELGTVLVRFQEQGDLLHGTVEVASREVRREIEQALPQVVRALQEAGVQIRRVEVVTSDQPERDPGGEHEPRDVWQQHQGTGQGREHSQGAPQVRWPRSAGGHSTIRQGVPNDEPRAAAVPGRIDVLL